MINLKQLLIFGFLAICAACTHVQIAKNGNIQRDKDKTIELSSHIEPVSGKVQHDKDNVIELESNIEWRNSQTSETTDKNKVIKLYK